MCGIVGIVSKENVTGRIFDSLSRLEYRGYDSAGIAVISKNKIDRRREEGKLSSLRKLIEEKPLKGFVGIGHTRWATHGLPVTRNAHPHSTNRVSVVHNGIIENFHALREEMEKAGYEFTSQTDTEVIPILITYYLDKGKKPFDAFHKTLQRLEGAFAIAAIFADDDGLLMAARKGSPLAIGYGKGEMYVASDAIALAPLTQKICYLEDNDFAQITTKTVKIFDRSGKNVSRETKNSGLSGAAVGKGNYRHFMLKEIHEQPTAIAETLNAYYDPVGHRINLPKTKFNLRDVSRITIVACGTSYYAGLVGKYWIEQLTGLPVEVDIASEYRYRKPVFDKNGMVLLISQSGETADTLAALKHAKENKQKIASIVNVQQSSIARESDLIIPILAGPEIGVASTKAFTSTLTNLAVLAISLAKNPPGLLQQLVDVPAMVADVLNIKAFEEVADELAAAQTILYLGRGTSFPIALEGALKLKEISYIHAEGYAAGELKHGPIALIDEKVPVIVIAPYDEYFGKTSSNVQEVAARGGKVILLSNKQGCKELKNIVHKAIEMPVMPSFTTPIVYAVPVQLLAYYTALVKGTDVDQPRNLAKSVTVE